MRRAHTFSVLGSTLAAIWIGTASHASADGSPTEDLRAFARLYGYVRFFHPSDEAAAMDWNRFAVFGAQRVLERDGETLRSVLNDMFQPIAPSMRLYASNEPPPAIPPGGVPQDGTLDVTTLKQVAWQHVGVGTNPKARYRSARTHRASGDSRAPGFGTISQSVSAEPYRGMRVRLRAAVRAEVDGGANGGQLWLRVDRPDRKRGFFDNMADRRVTQGTWDVYEIVGTVADDAERIVFGGFLKGEGRVWLDDFALEVEAETTWEPVTIWNADFTRSASEVQGWYHGGRGYAYAIVPEGASSANAVRIESEMTGRLFSEVPPVTAIVDKELGADLRVRMPLVLYSDFRSTLGADPQAVNQLLGELDAFEIPRTNAPALRIGAVTILWNVMQHFYPYFDVIDTDWDVELTRALEGALDAPDRRAFLRVLKRLVAALRDGHGYVHHEELSSGEAWLPVAAEWIDGAVVIVDGQVEGLERGDVIVSIDGTPARSVVEEGEQLISGSPQWKRYVAVHSIGRGARGSIAQVRVRRLDQELDIEIERTNRTRIAAHEHEEFFEIESRVFYVDLSRVPMDDLDDRMNELAAAKGVVFDLRGYPKSNHEIIQHLIDEPVLSARWNVAQTLYPDREKLVGYDTSGRWTLVPESPRIRGVAVFLTDARAISYAESFMGIVEHYRIAPIVGRPTAGANGNVNSVELPGGYTVGWTGMLVLKHDGSQHHLIGIQPTVPVALTLEAIREGRDEDLIEALRIIRRQ